MTSKDKTTQLHDLGLIDYQQAWDKQEQLFSTIVEIKQQNRSQKKTELKTPNFLLFCQHPHVYTLGKSGKEANILFNEQFLKSKGAQVYRINRGGDITYHGPGQVVCYPILDLDNFGLSIKSYIHSLEEVVIRSLKHFGLLASRLQGATGVWLDTGLPERKRKICAMGVRTSHWVSMHGFALNVSTDLDYFQYIVPCGIQGSSVTSIEKETGEKTDIYMVHQILIQEFESVFGMQLS